MIALCLDCETTSLIANHLLPLGKQPEVIEFFGMTVNLADGAVLDELHLFIQPSRPVSEEATRINRITNEMLATAPTFALVAPQIQAMIEAAPRVVAHNLSFDMEALDLEFERLQRAVVWPQELLCSVEQTVHLKGFRLSLNALHEHLFGEPFKEAHRADVDVRAMVRCLQELVQRGEL